MNSFLYATESLSSPPAIAICHVNFADTEKKLGRVVMSNENFASYIDQAAEMGFRDFSLTSSSGEIFFDKDASWKLNYLDNHPQVGAYQFYTNLVLPDEDMIERLFKLKKLDWLGFIIYGHDRESFTRITEKSDKQYDMLVANLNRIADRGGNWQGLI